MSNEDYKSDPRYGYEKFHKYMKDEILPSIREDVKNKLEEWLNTEEGRTKIKQIITSD